MERNKNASTNRIPTNAIVKALRQIHFSRNPKSRNIDLAKEIGIDPSSLSAYCSDKEFTPPRRCPDWVIMDLIKSLKVKVCISYDCVEIIEE